ncbi:hypothetical protein IRZ53_20325 [Pseudomonas fulva]|uniref:hypothetical protein n=1 Tax=Pseudomonas fulva TaxID=47880 RepID=UPI0018AB785A|nr:hypothetical protein [Pseudomonas fulva]MBF8676653.1 hypothetical protein [Pseudomonas fulva]MBF8699132.1 hypothetical protein [Pseudomonas fulva]
MKQHAELYLRSPVLFRCVALGLGLGMVAVCSLALYAIWVEVLPVFGRLYRSAPVVETSYGAFFVIGVIPLTPIVVAAAMIGVFTGRKFDPPRASWLERFQLRSFQASLMAVCIAAPVMIAVSTATLLIKDYRPCAKLRISGSSGHMFWVNDDRVCFIPDAYINDHWPCKAVGDRTVCVQVDGHVPLGSQVAR